MLEELFRWLNDNALLVQAVSAGATALATIVLVIVTWYYVKRTGGILKVSEDNLKELQKQHLDHQAQYQEEKDEQRKTCVLPVQWRFVWNAPKPTMAGHLEIQLDNIGPGPATDIEVRSVFKTGGSTLYRIGFFPGFVAGGSRWLPMADATQGQFRTWGVENWGDLPRGFGSPMTVEILCKNVRGDDMPSVRKVILKGDDVYNIEQKITPKFREGTLELGNQTSK